MKTIFNIQEKVFNTNIKNFTYLQKQEYYWLEDRIVDAFTLKYFLALRGSLKNYVASNYFDQPVNFSDYFSCHENFDAESYLGYTINGELLENYSNSYLRKLIAEIENHTLCLFDQSKKSRFN